VKRGYKSTKDEINSDLQVKTIMAVRDGHQQVPPDGFVDNPKQVSELLSRHLIPINIHDLPKRGDILKETSVKVDGILSRELLRLSLQDRNAINEEIHGVQTFAPKESPEMLAQALIDIDTEICKIQDKDAFHRSQQFPKTYVNSADFRLKFLRSNLFDVELAAKNMVGYLELISELYGDFALRRQIEMSDFSREEMQFFRVGHIQLLPYRDRSGRRILASVGGFGIHAALVTRVKILIYIMLAASEDLETQRQGITSVIWPGTKLPQGDTVNNIKLDRIFFMKRVYENIPLRTAAQHYCMPPTPFFKVMKALFIMSMPDHVKRMKFHVGVNVELQYSVKSYGIPVELIPLTDSGNIKTTYLKQWIKLRRMIEVMKMTDRGNDNSVSIIECPGSNDVVFRSGTSMSCHPGNVRFRCMVESKHETPSIVSQSTQAELAEQLIEEIEAGGGRYLKWDSRGYWTEMKDRLQIHTKVALSIRDFKYKSKAQRNRQTNQSYTYLFQCQDGLKRKRTNDSSQGEQSYCSRSW